MIHLDMTEGFGMRQLTAMIFCMYAASNVRMLSLPCRRHRLGCLAVNPLQQRSRQNHRRLGRRS